MNSHKQWTSSHKKHVWEAVSTDHIRNVDYLNTHDLIRCSCNWYGWVQKED